VPDVVPAEFIACEAVASTVEALARAWSHALGTWRTSGFAVRGDLLPGSTPLDATALAETASDMTPGSFNNSH